MLTLPEKKNVNIYHFTISFTMRSPWVCLAFFPSMASFFFRQLAQRKGPSHGFDAGEKKVPELTDSPSAGD